MNWFLAALKKGFTYQGRARRREFGWFMLITGIIQIGFSVLSWAAEMLNFAQFTQGIEIVSTLFSLALFIPSVNVTTRRLHDLGTSGWWQAGVLLLIIVLGFIAVAWLVPLIVVSQELNDGMSEAIAGTIGGLIGGVAPLLFYLFLALKDGQRKTNQYGEDPKAESVSGIETQGTQTF